MRRYLILLATFLTVFQSHAQRFRLELLRYENLSDSPALKEDPFFGGISGIDYVGGNWYLITDGRDPDRTSYLFSFDSTFQTQTYRRWALRGVRGAESLRYRSGEGAFYLTTEEGSGEAHGQVIRWTKDSTAIPIGSYTGFPNNKGYEGLALAPDSLLWGASEWPEQEQSPYARVFAYDLRKKDTVVTAFYPLVRDACGYPDNGISDILLTPEKEMIVMERCWSGEKDKSRFTIQLYVVSALPRPVPGESKTAHILAKTPLNVRWDSLRPDNLEGMTWGPVIDGHRTLVLISDNNFNKFDAGKASRRRQKTQLIFFKLVPI
ncbi:esterase-like activity of phytase family protein [Siphonobacter aquaeclarae]|uniref:Esterase-like activity of phytase n=1 Tax=Siphonobacter aquaeclarae TaxID=563176 RepID=A0A1G9XFL0_9BACT|nr:esterase-like activity of phytase family protein [Siphonobacter aquaeclarae]SDM95599.1 Esterase-like activity of phytase [Siphonobacter aquaeclarae]